MMSAEVGDGQGGREGGKGVCCVHILCNKPAQESSQVTAQAQTKATPRRLSSHLCMTLVWRAVGCRNVCKLLWVGFASVWR